MAAVEQLSLFDRAEEARAYHDPARAGFFSILVNDQGEKKQSSHRLIEMPTVLELIDKTRDTWMTQAEFIRPNRRVVNLARIGLLFADLDTGAAGSLGAVLLRTGRHTDPLNAHFFRPWHTSQVATGWSHTPRRLAPLERLPTLFS
jgi:hypothetical protein